MVRINLIRVMVPAVVMMMVIVVMAAGDSNADEEGISIDDVQYDIYEKKVYFSGTSDYPYVSIIVFKGDETVSPMDTSSVVNGHFEDRMYVDSLTNGQYVLEVWYMDHKVQRSFTVDDSIIVQSVGYNKVTGKIFFEGLAAFPFVSTIVFKGDETVSPMDTSSVVNGHFKDTYYVGILQPGAYRVLFKYLDTEVYKEFSVSASDLTITDVLFDEDKALITIIGENCTGADPQFIVTAPGNLSYSFTYWYNNDGGFVAYASVGKLQNGGDYIIGAGESFNLDPLQFTYENYDNSVCETIDGNVLCDNGHTLVRFTGDVDVYTFPSSVTRVMDGAFNGSRIGKIVLDRDLTWDIKKKDGMTFMFQDCNLSSIEIREGVTSIPDYLFAKTKITELTFPSSLSSIGVKAFYDCNNLVTISFRDNSCITTIDDYSFSHNENLTDISFGSSKQGCQCEIGVAAFFFCDDLRTVVMDDNFYLRAIGAYAFTKPEHYYGDVISISFNSDNGIIIPKETQEIGDMAFSACRDGMIIAAIASNHEPLIGYVRGNPSPGSKMLIGDVQSIVFEDGSQITSIGKYAFVNYDGVTLIDLSGCANLKVIQTGAFTNSMKNGILRLPPNVEELYESFKKCTIYEEMIVLPNSLKVADRAFDGTRCKLVAQEGSQLEYYHENTINFYEKDFRECKNLSYIYSQGENVRIPPGMYDGEVGRNSFLEGTPPEITDTTVTITADTTYMCWEYAAFDVIVCSEDNAYFKEVNGGLYYVGGGSNVLLRVITADSFVISDGAVVRDGLLGSKLVDLTIKADNVLAPRSLSKCDSLMTLTIKGKIDLVLLESSLAGIRSYPSLYLDQSYDDAELVQLSAFGNLYVAIQLGDSVLYAPALFEGAAVHYQKMPENDYITTDLDLDRIVVLTSGLSVSVEGPRIKIVESTNHSEVSYLWFVKEENNVSKVNVDLHYNGGNVNGKGLLNVAVVEGTTLSGCEFTLPTKNLSSFRGWALTEEGDVLSQEYVINSDTSLYALWESRNPLVTVDDSVATIRSGGNEFTTTLVNIHSDLELTAEPNQGFELLNWIVNGDVVSSAKSSLVLTNIIEDVEVSLEARYYSTSSGLNSTVDRGLPSIDTTDNLVNVIELGGRLDTTNAIWEGHSSVPLIIDNHLYFRAGNYLYMAESDTGYILKSVESAEAKSYYHQIGYGDGVIIDYKTGKAYDENLNLLYTLERPVPYGVQFYDGKFYTSGKDLYSFTPHVDETVVNGIKSMNFIGHIDHVYSTYGITMSVFVDHFVYRIVADDLERGIAAMDLNTGQIKIKYLDSIRSMYLDDGWISYHDGYIYLPAYTTGLFGEIATDADDTLVYISVNGLEFGEEHSYVFEGKRGWVSETLFYGDHAYISVNGVLHSFEINNGVIDPDSLRTTTLVTGHGSMVMDTSHMADPEPALYFYGIPYYTKDVGLSVAVDMSGILSSYNVRGLPVNYNSQAVRSDIDGRMIWYNDSGHIFDYTVPDKNVFFFFIDDGEHAQWYQAYGKTAAIALSSLGKDVVDLDDYLRITSVYGHNPDGMQIYALKQNAQADIKDNLKSYDWIRLYDLYDRSYDTCHYYRIVTSSGVSDSYAYIDDSGSIQEYLFVENIGDRNIVGKMLIPNENVRFIRYYNGSEEIVELRSLYSSDRGASWNLPNIVKGGIAVKWYDSDNNLISSLKALTESGSDVALMGIWFDDSIKMVANLQKVQNDYEITIAVPVQDSEIYLKAVVQTQEGYTELSYELNEVNSWNASIIVSSESSVLLYIVRDSSQSFEYNVGCTLICREAIS